MKSIFVRGFVALILLTIGGVLYVNNVPSFYDEEDYSYIEILKCSEKENSLLDILANYEFKNSREENQVLFAVVKESIEGYELSEYLIDNERTLKINLPNDEELVIMVHENSTILYEWNLDNIDNVEVNIDQKHLESKVKENDSSEIKYGRNNDKRVYLIKNNNSINIRLGLSYNHIDKSEQFDENSLSFSLNINEE